MKIVFTMRDIPRPAAAPDWAAMVTAKQQANTYPTHENNRQTIHERKRSCDYHMTIMWLIVMLYLPTKNTINSPHAPAG